MPTDEHNGKPTESNEPAASGSFSINEMMSSGSGASSPDAQPDWMIEEEQPEHPFNQNSGFTETDFVKMRQDRLRREAKPSLMDRLHDGDVRVGLGRTTGGLVGLGNLITKPFAMLAENTGVLLGGVVLLVLLWTISLVGVEALEWYVSDF